MPFLDRFKRNAAPKFWVIVGPTEVQFCGSDSTVSISVDSIQEIAASLFDDFTTDTIWLSFTSADGATYNLSEDAEGFIGLVSWLEQNGLITNESWYTQVTRPPFQKSMVTVFLSCVKRRGLGSIGEQMGTHELASSSWLYDEESTDALIQHLARLEEAFGTVAIFVRRIACVPLNYPVRMNDQEVVEAEPLLTDDGDAPLTLAGYWMNLQAFSEFTEIVEIEETDLQIFRAADLMLVCGLRIFEDVLTQFGVERRDHLLLPSLEPSSPRAAGLPRVNMYQMCRFLTDAEANFRMWLTGEGLALAKPAKISDLTFIGGEQGIAFAPKVDDFNVALNRAWLDPLTHAIAHDYCLRDSSCMLAAISSPERVRANLDRCTDIPFGTFLFFTKEWTLIESICWRNNKATCEILHREVFI